MLGKLDSVCSRIRLITGMKTNIPNNTITNETTDATNHTTTNRTINKIPEDIQMELKPCPTCGRTFNPTTLEKHVMICGKMSKKRQVFDSFLQRRITDKNVEYTRVSPTSERPKTKKANDVAQPSKSKGTAVCRKPPQLTKEIPTCQVLPPNDPKKASPLNTSPTKEAKGKASPRLLQHVARLAEKTLEPCPHCGRSFSQKAFDNHVEWCSHKSVVASFDQYGSETNSLAKQRMKLRIHYKPPVPKTKRNK